MSDRAAASLFGLVFSALAEDDFDRLTFAKHLLMKEVGAFDFVCSQMGCDGALKKLGLTRESQDVDGEPLLLYYGEDYDEAEAK